MEAMESGVTSARSRTSVQWGPGKPVTSVPLHVRRVTTVAKNEAKDETAEEGKHEQESTKLTKLGISAFDLYFTDYLYWVVWAN